MKNWIILIAKIVENPGLEYIPGVLNPPEININFLTLPGEIGGQSGAAWIRYCQIAPQIFDYLSIKGANSRKGDLYALSIRQLTRRFESEFMFWEIKLHLFTKFIKFRDNADLLWLILSAFRTKFYNHSFNRSIELPDRPEKRRRILHSVLNRHFSQKIELSEIKAGLFSFGVELNPWKSPTPRSSEYYESGGYKCDSQSEKDEWHILNIEPPTDILNETLKIYYFSK